MAVSLCSACGAALERPAKSQGACRCCSTFLPIPRRVVQKRLPIDVYLRQPSLMRILEAAPVPWEQGKLALSLLFWGIALTLLGLGLALLAAAAGTAFLTVGRLAAAGVVVAYSLYLIGAVILGTVPEKSGARPWAVRLLIGQSLSLLLAVGKLTVLSLPALEQRVHRLSGGKALLVLADVAACGIALAGLCAFNLFFRVVSQYYRQESLASEFGYHLATSLLAGSLLAGVVGLFLLGPAGIGSGLELPRPALVVLVIALVLYVVVQSVWLLNLLSQARLLVAAAARPTGRVHWAAVKRASAV